MQEKEEIKVICPYTNLCKSYQIKCGDCKSNRVKEYFEDRKDKSYYEKEGEKVFGKKGKEVISVVEKEKMILDVKRAKGFIKIDKEYWGKAIMVSTDELMGIVKALQNLNIHQMLVVSTPDALIFPLSDSTALGLAKLKRNKK
jgi:hypothetical protein